MTADAFWKPFEVEINDFNGLVHVINQVMDKAVEGGNAIDLDRRLDDFSRSEKR